MYLSQDPIGLAGGHMLYGYVHDVNTYIDSLGLRKKYSELKTPDGIVLGSGKSGTLDLDTIKDIEFRNIVKSSVESIREKGLGKDFHGHCAEIHAINDALNNGYSLGDLKGSQIHIVEMFEGKPTAKIVPACDCCSEVLSKIGIKDGCS
jgi:hypothetical protein